MKKFLLNALIIFQISFFTNQPLMAQTDSSIKISWIKIKLKTMDNIKLTGYLYHAEPDSVVILKEKLKNITPGSLKNPPIPWVTSIAPQSIEKIIIQKGRRAPLYGSLIGLGTGVLLGYASGSDPEGSFFRWTATDKAIILGTTGLVTGALVGTIIYFTSKKVFKINGNTSQYKNSRSKLAKYDVFHGVF
ncbi:MAG: hypothetical protein C5B52_00260 [Bacteroidetes bacterium]|nr:MAG: hypothetical protein C5B52_00260 [Bacteroidota bacterium]